MLSGGDSREGCTEKGWHWEKEEMRLVLSPVGEGGQTTIPHPVPWTSSEESMSGKDLVCRSPS